MFRSDWLLDDPIEVITDFQKSLLTMDELDSLTTNENLSDIDKALYLLEKGQINQKLWVARTLACCMHSPGFESLIAELIVNDT